MSAYTTCARGPHSFRWRCPLTTDYVSHAKPLTSFRTPLRLRPWPLVPVGTIRRASSLPLYRYLCLGRRGSVSYAMVDRNHILRVRLTAPWPAGSCRHFRFVDHRRCSDAFGVILIKVCRASWLSSSSRRRTYTRVRYDHQGQAVTGPDGGSGRHSGLKIRRLERAVGVQVPLRVPTWLIAEL